MTPVPPKRRTATEPDAPAAPRELAAYLESLPEPHILFDSHYRIAAANSAYRRQFSDGQEVVGQTCYSVSHHIDVPCDQAGETCPLARARLSNQRERVLHLHHTPQGQSYVNIELVPLGDGRSAPGWFIEKMEPLRLAQGQPAAQGLIGRAPAFQAMLGLVARVGPTEASVVLLGESGTGKELVARAVHAASGRSSRPLVVVDCASVPETLFESELFGHERGAFTGAHAARPGLVEAAATGTLFLDEVGDIPLPMQVKLLRLLESGTFRRVGSTELRRADIRVISATHRDLGSLIRQGRFREDLYHRLGTFPIRLPALRDRRDDIPLLADSLLERIAPARGLKLAAPALELLAAHPFPGNVRELRNVLERATVLTDGPVVDDIAVSRALEMGAWGPGSPTPASGQAPTAGALTAGFDTFWTSGPSPATATAAPPRSPRSTLREAERQAEQAALRAALASHRGDRRALAQQLGISLRTLYRKLSEMQGAR